ncbi:hypothetical protein B0T19DRAFT_65736 [Cercophora scortea]|uniref:Uncharacterized protein n=1 Tax=Cercophora scortea TaxID=314031 RepID=A0AAE0J5D2_9PEZI|nr:hypothetical protein B0T19DRAFT_65736 [Cercophora scortea]
MVSNEEEKKRNERAKHSTAQHSTAQHSNQKNNTHTHTHTHTQPGLCVIESNPPLLFLLFLSLPLSLSLFSPFSPVLLVFLDRGVAPGCFSNRFLFPHLIPFANWLPGCCQLCWAPLHLERKTMRVKPTCLTRPPDSRPVAAISPPFNAQFQAILYLRDSQGILGPAGAFVR